MNKDLISSILDCTITISYDPNLQQPPCYILTINNRKAKDFREKLDKYYNEIINKLRKYLNNNKEELSEVDLCKIELYENRVECIININIFREDKIEDIEKYINEKIKSLSNEEVLIK